MKTIFLIVLIIIFIAYFGIDVREIVDGFLSSPDKWEYIMSLF